MRESRTQSAMKSVGGLLLILCFLLCLFAPAAYRVPAMAFTATILWRRLVSRSPRKSSTLPGGQHTVGGHFLNEDEVQGLLFDCDGTLLDTMPLFFHSWEEVSSTQLLCPSECTYVTASACWMCCFDCRLLDAASGMMGDGQWGAHAKPGVACIRAAREPAPVWVVAPTVCHNSDNTCLSRCARTLGSR